MVNILDGWRKPFTTRKAILGAWMDRLLLISAKTNGIVKRGRFIGEGNPDH